MAKGKIIREKQKQIIQTIYVISFGIVMFLLLYYLLIIKEW